MAQWQELLKLDSALQKRVMRLYEGKFPTEVRHSLSHWIESQDWDSAAVDEEAARGCFQGLLEHLMDQWKRSVQENNILQGPNFSGMRDCLEKNFQDQPMNLAALLSESLKEEKMILASAAAAPTCSSPVMTPPWTALDNQVMEIKLQMSDLKKEVKILEGLNEELDFIQRTWQSKVEQNGRLAQTQAQTQVEQECLKRALVIAEKKQVVLQQLLNMLNQASHVQMSLTGVELPEWKRRQQLASIGSPENTSLELLQKWFTAVTEVLLGVREQLQKMLEMNHKYSRPDSMADSITQMDQFTLSLIRNLLTSALVVEKQPVMQNLPHRPLILKTGVRFKVTVRFLANLLAFKDLLKVKPVFDKDVKEEQTVSWFRLFDFTVDHSKVLDVDGPDGALRAAFEHMSLKEKKSRTKGSCESPLTVTEELHIIRFVAVLHYAGEKFNIEASSLPVVIVSSSNQVPSAWAAIMWSNMVSTGEPMNLSLFLDPPALTWQQVAQLLNWQFLSVGRRGLDQDQLSVLQDKIMDNPEGLLCWSKFSKDESVWMWIDGILDLIKKYLSELWQNGYIMGFVSKRRTSSLLLKKPTGTFLIRFSESIRDGAITFSWVDHSSGESHVHAVQPYTKKELSVLSLPDAINHYTLTTQGRSSNPLLYLYPDIPKDSAFGNYYQVSGPSTTNNNIKEYVQRILAVVSINPTPPPSPPRDVPPMDIESLEPSDWLEDILSCLMEPEFLQLAPQEDFQHVDFPLSDSMDH
ncbi:signal transducer and activator of transcription 1-alpha/beta-like [Cyprinodon tularosa]|uniref:signal transducer and activator of transcription 1-alpha/beta-like n=1 Tax=Cyprinodon tularosa TaxID=77115 RepID=UPI0018E1DA4B|nr:signal transducer and activator of transcription 1-alpha/beta-like [Cyprinodon tularosa]